MKTEWISKLLKSKKMTFIVLFVLFSFALFFVYFEDYSNDRIIMSGDGQTFVNEQVFIKHTLEETGEFPLWNKWLTGGIPFVTDIPLSAVFSVLPEKLMIYAIYICIVALGAAFMFLYLREINCSPTVSVVISVCYLFSIHLGGARKNHMNIVLATAFIPIILFFIEKYFSTRKLGWLFWTSAAMAVQFGVGQLQHIVYTDIFVAIYLIAFGLHYKIKISTMLKHGVAWAATFFALILWRIMPMLEQVFGFLGDNSSGTTFDTFVSYSIHPIKLIQTIFPKFFNGEIYMAFGLSYSSEMDIELFLGYVVFILAMVAIIFRINEFRTRFFLFSMGVVFAYSAMGSMPGLAEVVYRIPYIGDFRCPARALILFIFMAFVLAAMGLTWAEKEGNFRKLVKFSAAVSATIAVIVFTAVTAIAIYIGINNGFTTDSFSELQNYFSEFIKDDMIVVLIIPVLFAGIYFYKGKNYGPKHQLLCILTVIATLFQTLPYSTFRSVMSLENTDERTIQLASEIGNYKIWDAFRGVDGAHDSIIARNIGMVSNIATINAHIHMNNPYLYRLLTQESKSPMNYSGLLTGSIKATQNVRLQNSLLSMLGVRYLIDSSGIIAADNSFYTMTGNGNLEYHADEIVIPDLNGELYVTGEKLEVKNGNLYMVDFSVASNSVQELVFDLYSVAGYDDLEQEYHFTINNGENDYSALIFSGDNVPEEDVYWRLISSGTEEYVVRDFNITLMEILPVGQYQLWRPDLDGNIYVNESARDVLYVPDRIEKINDTEDIYRNTVAYALDRINYMVNTESKELYPETVILSGIDFGSNKIEATISTEEDTFVNFSQCWYPGWRAYVDGEKVDIYMVNGLIMGMEVPAGEHEITFKFVPVYFFVGLAVSLTTLAGLMLALVVKWRKKKPKK